MVSNFLKSESVDPYPFWRMWVLFFEPINPNPYKIDGFEFESQKNTILLLIYFVSKIIVILKAILCYKETFIYK